MYSIFTLKRYLEQVVMFPLVLLGKMIARFRPLGEAFDLFFFFPGYAIGGAERVNAEIIKAFPDKRIVIFFTKNSPDAGMKHFFELPNVRLIEINRWTSSKWMYWSNFIYRGICSSYINRQKHPPVVFIGQANFGYKLTPHIKRSIRIVELIHMVDNRFLWIWAPFIKFIDVRVVLAETIRQDFEAIYKKEGIPFSYAARIQVIPNCLEFVPPPPPPKTFGLPLKIYYAGRGGPQKRIGILLWIIAECHRLQLPVKFTLVGSFEDEVPAELKTDGTYIGPVQGGAAMYAFQQSQDVLLMTSAWEGFPMVIMEAQVFGAIPLVCGVGAIPEYITEGKNGYLLNPFQSNEAIAAEAVEKIQYLLANRALLPAVSQNGYQYIVTHFSAANFQNAYRQALLEEPAGPR